MGKTALILAGHGSHISPETAGLVWRCVDAMRYTGAANEITAAFWKETPSFHEVFNSLTADDITIVPLFTAQGYFTQTVIPAEMGLDGPVTVRNGRTIRYTEALGVEVEHIAKAIRVQIWLSIKTWNLPFDKTAVAIIGHSTRRNPESRKATETQAEKLRQAGIVAEVVAVYLDDAPEISEVYKLTSAPNLIAIPYFLALGSHVTIDIPERLGLKRGYETGFVNGRSVYYAMSRWIEPMLGLIIEQRLYKAGVKLGGSASSDDVWWRFPTAGRDDLIAAVREAETLQFGQLVLTMDEVKPSPPTPLPQGEGLKESEAGGEVLIQMPAQLRDLVRAPNGNFRPLPTSSDLPGGWRVEIKWPEKLHSIVETVYPGAVADWAAHRRREFVAGSFESTIARQTGMYRPLAGMPVERQREVVERVCGKCVRHATWFHGESPEGAIPCTEPCNMWLTRALETLEDNETTETSD